MLLRRILISGSGGDPVVIRSGHQGPTAPGSMPPGHPGPAGAACVASASGLWHCGVGGSGGRPGRWRRRQAARVSDSGGRQERRGGRPYGNILAGGAAATLKAGRLEDPFSGLVLEAVAGMVGREQNPRKPDWLDTLRTASRTAGRASPGGAIERRHWGAPAADGAAALGQWTCRPMAGAHRHAIETLRISAQDIDPGFFLSGYSPRLWLYLSAPTPNAYFNLFVQVVTR